jgi:hypothetical protein
MWWGCGSRMPTYQDYWQAGCEHLLKEHGHVLPNIPGC